MTQNDAVIAELRRLLANENSALVDAQTDVVGGIGRFVEAAKAFNVAVRERLPTLLSEMEARDPAPWATFDGDLPDYDHPLRCVFESGVQYAVDLLAKVLKVEDYQVCDGTEEFDGDLGGTMFNIVLAAMPKDEHGDELHPSELPQVIDRASLANLTPSTPESDHGIR